jgi:hypothetical protein
MILRIFASTAPQVSGTAAAVAPVFKRSMICKIPVAIAVQKILQLICGTFLRDSIPFLEPAEKAIARAVRYGAAIIGQIAPACLEPAPALSPIAFETIPVHVDLLLMRHSGVTPVARPGR